MGENVPAEVRIGDSVLHQSLHNEIVLLNMATCRYYGLNDIGARMWELLIELHDVRTVADRLQSAYEVDHDTLQADLDRLVRELLDAGLLAAA